MHREARREGEDAAEEVSQEVVVAVAVFEGVVVVAAMLAVEEGLGLVEEGGEDLVDSVEVGVIEGCQEKKAVLINGLVFVYS